DWVVMLDGGRLVRSGPVGGAGATSSLIVELIGDPLALVETLQNHGLEVAVDHQRVTITNGSEESYDLIRDTVAGLGLGLLRLTSASHSLEDEFLVQVERDRS
ncbi:MAG: ABC transporter ATP-binding protein, partial [Acidimicrobiia bacterium]|nr:ABC transporter ATP-binding protein [Acidimicrobiia bacterium]